MNHIISVRDPARQPGSDRPEELNNGAVRGLDANVIAALRDEDIKAMATNDLVGVIRAGQGLLPCGDSDEHLHLKDRRCLIRLAFLARRSMRNHLHGPL